MKILTIYFILLCSFTACSSENTKTNLKEKEMEIDTTGHGKIIQTYLKEGAWNHHYVTKEWHEWIDKGLAQDSTVAMLWQQKALPYWKLRKYDLAISYYDKAVSYNREHYLSRLGFLKCVFAKRYESALADIQAYLNEFGETYENDHTLRFYEALCYLGLNRYQDALDCLKPEIDKQEKERGAKWVHYLERFYLGITYYELGNYEMAIKSFDKVLNEYSTFSDGKFWKGKCLIYLGKKEEGKALMKAGYEDYKQGYTINEASSLYEPYPYQITWEWPYLVK